MNKIKTLLVAVLIVGMGSFFTCVSASAAGWSSISGAVNASAGSFGSLSAAGFDGGFSGNAGSSSNHDATNVNIGGIIDGYTVGRGGEVSASVGGYGSADQGRGFTDAYSGSDAFSSAFNGAVSARSYGNSGASHWYDGGGQ